MLARYALFCAGCALVQLAYLTRSRSARAGRAALSAVADAYADEAVAGAIDARPSHTFGLVLRLVALLTLVAEAAIGFWLFHWWVAVVVGGTVSVLVGLVALEWRGLVSLVLGVILFLAGALLMSGWL